MDFVRVPTTIKEWWSQVSCDPDTLLAPRQPTIKDAKLLYLFPSLPCVPVSRAGCNRVDGKLYRVYDVVGMIAYGDLHTTKGILVGCSI